MTDAATPVVDDSSWEQAVSDARKSFEMSKESEAEFEKDSSPESLYDLLRQAAEESGAPSAAPHRSGAQVDLPVLELPRSDHAITNEEMAEVEQALLLMLSVAAEFRHGPYAGAGPLPMERQLLKKAAEAAAAYRNARRASRRSIGRAPLVAKLTEAYERVCAEGACLSKRTHQSELRQRLREHLPDLTKRELADAVKELTVEASDIRVDNGPVQALRMRLARALPERHRISEQHVRQTRKASALDSYRVQTTGERFAGLDASEAIPLVLAVLNRMLTKK